MTSLDRLLPASDEAPRCADHGRAIGLDPGGTAIRADRIVLIATPQPWPKPVFDHPRLVQVRPVLARSARPTRVLANVAATDDLPEAVEVVTFDRGRHGSDVIERRFTIGEGDGLMELATALSVDDEPAIDRMTSYRSAVTDPVVLICTQGSHDVCCGSDGARFASEVEATGDIVVYRVSHTGGHRFAPTALTLPDGRMWADLDLDLLRQILWRTGDAADLVDRCRGWWGADIGPAQVAERSVLAAEGWSMEDEVRSIEVVPVDPALDPTNATRCVVTVGERRWEVVVAPGREVPTIACRQPGGLPAKPGREYAVHRVVAPAQ